MSFEIYTDGSIADRGIATGGWAFCIVEVGVGVIYEESGSQDEVTISRMEILALRNAMDWATLNLPDTDTINVYCDSKYVVNACNVWIDSWVKNDWLKYDYIDEEKLQKGWIERPHRDLFEEIKELEKIGNFKFNWVRSHNGNEYNEYVDDLAFNAYR